MTKYFQLTVLALILFYSSSAQVSNQSLIQFQKKMALVIGNGNYIQSILANPESDARAMKTALQNVGFTVIECENLDKSSMLKAIDDFGSNLKNNDVGLFYYAGHGIQSKGYNYLIPVDAKLKSESEIEYDCVQADRILALLEASGTKVNIIILDACRNNPFERSWTRTATGRGLAFMNAPTGTLIAYATSPGSTASDGSGKNGLYTSAILESIQKPDITIIQMFQNVRSIVSEKSSKQQIPWESTSLTGDFYFKLEDSSKIIKNGNIKFNVSSSVNTKEPESKRETNKINLIQKDYIWSILSLSSIVKSYTENGYTTENKFGTWNPIYQVYQTKVLFDENGLIKEIEDYNPERKSKDSKTNIKADELIGKTIYQSISHDSISVVKYNSTGLPSKKYFIYFLNDTTVLVEKDKFILENYKLAKMVPPRESDLKKLWIYTDNGLISNVKKTTSKKTEILNRYEYLEYDIYGNWTKRLEFGSSSNPDFIVIREYKY
jgi:hypothetical protein